MSEALRNIIEIVCYHMLNPVDERDLFLRTSQFEIQQFVS